MAAKNKKQLIYEAAAKLFQEKGYAAASMRDLAESVNLKVSSLYSHIRKKEEILQKICFDNAHRFLEGLDAIEVKHHGPLEQMESIIHLHIDIALDDPTSITVFNDEWKHLDQPYYDDFIKLRKDYENRLLKIIKTGIDSGIFRPVSPNTTLFTTLTALRWIHYWNPDQSPGNLHKDITSLLLGGMIK